MPFLELCPECGTQLSYDGNGYGFCASCFYTTDQGEPKKQYVPLRTEADDDSGVDPVTGLKYGSLTEKDLPEEE